MLNIKTILLKNKGFTLIEVILVLGISSLILLPILSILDLSIKKFDRGEQKDDLLLNGRYAIEYIKDEIHMGDKIIDSSKFSGLKEKYPTNIGFVIMMNKEEGYRYITYHIQNNKLIRIACNQVKKDYPSQFGFDGFNVVSEYIDNIEQSSFKPRQSMVFLDFKLKHRDEVFNLKSNIYIRCPIDY